MDALRGVALDWTLQLSESRLARVHYIIRCGDGARDRVRRRRRSRPASSTRSAPGTDDLREALIDEHGEEDGIRLFKRYERAFPAGYKADWVARSAVADIGRIEELASTDEPITSLYRPLESPEGIVRLKLFSSGRRAAVRGPADARAPRGEGRRRAPVRDHAGRWRPAWIYDFGLQADAENTERGPRPAPRRVRRRVAGRARGRRAQRPRARRHPDRTAGVDHPRGRQVPAPGRASASRTPTSSARCSHIPTSRGCWSGCSTRGWTPTATTDDAAERLGERDRGGARRRSQPRRGPHPAQLPVGRPRDRPHQRLPEPTATASRTRTCRSSSTPTQIPVAAAAKAAVRDLRLLAAGRGSPPARRQGGARRPALVGSARGLPHRGARPDEGPDGQERADRAGRGEGRLRAQAAAADGGREAVQREGIACYKTFLSGMLDITDNIVDGEVVPPDARGALRRRRPVPRRRRGQGHRDVLRHRQRSLAPTTASGWATRSPRVARRATTTRRWGSPRAEPGSRSSATSASSAPTSRPRTSPRSGIGDMSGDVFGNGMLLSRHTKLDRGVQPHARVHRPRPGPGGRATRSASGCSSCRARPGATTTSR